MEHRERDDHGGGVRRLSQPQQNLGPWDVRKVANMSQMMRDSGLTPRTTTRH